MRTAVLIGCVKCVQMDSCFSARVQAGARGVHPGGHRLEEDRVLRQPAMHRPHREQARNTGTDHIQCCEICLIHFDRRANFWRNLYSMLRLDVPTISLTAN